jgi:hypothetical protein
MTKANLLGPWVRRFLLEYLVSERNLARNTQCSYRDPFVCYFRCPSLGDKSPRCREMDASPICPSGFVTRTRDCSLCWWEA